MAKTKAEKRWEHYKALQRQEVNRLRKVVETHGGSFTWYDYDKEEWKDEDFPIVLANSDNYCGNIDVRRVRIDEKGIVKMDANDTDGWAELTLNTDDIAFGHIDFITDLIPIKQ